jgi:hypothetical protein
MVTVKNQNPCPRVFGTPLTFAREPARACTTEYTSGIVVSYVGREHLRTQPARAPRQRRGGPKQPRSSSETAQPALRMGGALAFGRVSFAPILTFLDSSVFRDEFIGPEDAGGAARFALVASSIRNRTYFEIRLPAIYQPLRGRAPQGGCVSGLL